MVSLGNDTNAPHHHEASAASTSSQILPRRRAAPVLAVAPSNTKALRPSSIAAPRRGRPRGTGTGRCADVVPQRAHAPPQTPRARAPSRHRPAVAASRRCTPTARKPAPTISHKPVAPRRTHPPASPMTRGPPRSAPSRVQVVLSARSKSQGRRPNSSSPSPATCRESCGLGAATPRRYDLTSAGRAFQASFSAPRAAFGARPLALRLGLGRLRPPRPAPPTPARPPARTAAQSEDGRPVLACLSQEITRR